MDPKAFLWHKPEGNWGQPKDCTIYNLYRQTGRYGEDLSKFRFADNTLRTVRSRIWRALRVNNYNQFNTLQGIQQVPHLCIALEHLLVMIRNIRPSYFDNLQFSLNVLNAQSHLGLDSQYASQLRAILEKQIAQAEQSRLTDSR